MGINVLSLFDGISCGRVALGRAGIPINKYFASEIDKHAIAVTKNKWPDTIHLGDVKHLNGKTLPPIDLILAGSPCQSFSNAGNGMGFKGKSGLFYEFVRILKEVNPKYFLLENVAMKKEWSDVISNELGVKPIIINSSLVSAQNRKRAYWTNIPNISQPEDRKIMLSDVIDQDYDGIWVWPRGTNCGGVKDYNGKSPSVTISSWQYNFLIYHDGTETPKFTKNKLKMVGHINSIHHSNRVYSSEGKSPTLLSSSGGISGKGNSLIMVKDKVRRFTINEVEALQTLDKDYTIGIPMGQRFKCCGNGWTVDVISHILNSLKPIL